MGAMDNFGLFMFGISMIILGVVVGFFVGIRAMSIIPVIVGVIALFFLRKR